MICDNLAIESAHGCYGNIDCLRLEGINDVVELKGVDMTLSQTQMQAARDCE